MKTEQIKAELKPDKVDGNTGEIIEIRPSLVEVAQQLKAYMDAKGDRAVFFNGLRYCEFDDYQFIADKYGLKVRTFDPQFVEIMGHKGFKAKASILDAANNEVGRAESFCMDDEVLWKRRPLFNLASMAQTRAATKAYANLFRPVARMAGVEGTPAEEMPEDAKYPPKEIPPPTPEEIDAGEEEMSEEVAALPPPDVLINATQEDVDKMIEARNRPEDAFRPPSKKPGSISEKQEGLLRFKLGKSKVPDKVWKAWMRDNLDVEHLRDIQWRDMDRCLKWIDKFQAL